MPYINVARNWEMKQQGGGGVGWGGGGVINSASYISFDYRAAHH